MISNIPGGINASRRLSFCLRADFPIKLTHPLRAADLYIRRKAILLSRHVKRYFHLVETYYVYFRQLSKETKFPMGVGLPWDRRRWAGFCMGVCTQVRPGRQFLCLSTFFPFLYSWGYCFSKILSKRLGRQVLQWIK